MSSWAISGVSSSTTAGRANADQCDNGLHGGQGKRDLAAIASVLISDTQVMASNIADEHIRDWALDASPLDRLLSERGPLDQFQDDVGQNIG